MNVLTVSSLYDVIANTWPAASTVSLGPWIIRDGANGGSRVSCATVQGNFSIADLPAAEAAMIALKQRPLFMIRDTDHDLDEMLAQQGYEIKDPVNIYVAEAADLAHVAPPPVTVFDVWPPLASQRDIWAAGGIGAGRLAVMNRAPHPKTTFLGRANDCPAGTMFVGGSKGCAMIHALEIAEDHRRKGLARYMTIAAAFWASSNGLKKLALVTTQANEAANRLYTSLGMQVVGKYHYRIMPKDVARDE